MSCRPMYFSRHAHRSAQLDVKRFYVMTAQNSRDPIEEQTLHRYRHKHTTLYESVSNSFIVTAS